MSRRAFAQTGTLTTGDTTGEVRLSTDPSQEEAQIWTIQFAISAAPDFQGAPLTGWIRPVATVTWMVAGNQVVRQMEVGDGATISGACQAATIRVTDQSTAVPAGVQYSVTVTATPGLRPVSPNPPFLLAGVNAATIAPSASETLTRPKQSGVSSFRVLLGGTGLSTNPPNVNLTGGPGAPATAAFSFDMVGATMTDSGWLPWPPEAALKLIIANLDTMNPIRATVFWGIDG